LQSQAYEETERVINKIKEIQGTVSIVLFGSLSRGEYDEGSDIDLLIVFKNKKDLDKGLKEIYKTTAKSDLFFQVTGLTLEELQKSPLLETALREGKIYYIRQDAEKLLTPTRKPYALVTYTTANLNAKERVIFTQDLEGRRKGKYRYEGLIHKIGGYKVGRGVVMVPLGNLKTLTEQLEKKKIDYVIRYVWT
jgi:predicted nucleotidyltransferase